MTLLTIFDSIAKSFYNNFIVENRYMHIVDGLETTLIITFFAVILGTFPEKKDTGMWMQLL